MARARHIDKVYKEPSQRIRRYWGMLALLTVISSAFGVLVSLSAGIRPERLESFSVVQRKQFTPSFGPITLAFRGFPPNTSRADLAGAKSAHRSRAVRAISVSAHDIALLVAGKEVRSIHMAKPVHTIQRLTRLVDNPVWIAETVPGQITLRAALVTTSGVKMRIGGSQVQIVRMASIPGVFIGTDGGNLYFRGVIVEAIAASRKGDSYYRPFVMAGDGVLDVTGSTFKGLGWNWNASYGTSWEDGSTGRATGSTFENCYIGVYTGYSHNILFRNDVFRNNAVYGLDPHSYSHDLTIDHVLAEHNRAHGIIFSNHVTHSIVEDSTSRENGENGIMMDRFSTHNRIIGNTAAGNKGDGLVASLSSDNVFSSNIVTRNRIGVRLDLGDSQRLILTHNQIDENDVATQNITLNGTNATAMNGNQWDLSIIVDIWLCVALILLLAAAVLAIKLRRPTRIISKSAILSLSLFILIVTGWSRSDRIAACRRRQQGSPR